MASIVDDAPLAVTTEMLRALPVLNLLAEDQFAQLLAVARIARYPKRATVVLKGREVEIQLKGRCDRCA